MLHAFPLTVSRGVRPEALLPSQHPYVRGAYRTRKYPRVFELTYLTKVQFRTKSRFKVQLMFEMTERVGCIGGAA